MISQTRFEQEFKQMVNLSGLIVRAEAIGMYFDKLKHWNEEAVFKGMDHIVEDPPNKLTLSVFKSHIRQTKVGENQTKWNGTECDECDSGLIFINRDGNSYVFRCLKCKSYKVNAYSWHTPEEVFNLETKLKRIKDGLNNDGKFFINKESHQN